MNELTPNDVSNDDLPQLDELTVLKERAKSLGVAHGNNIGVDALRAKIAAHLAGENVPTDVTDDAPVETQPELTGVVPGVNTGYAAADPMKLANLSDVPSIKQGETPKNARQKLIAEATKLVRCRITNLDPKKKDWPGEIFTVANDYIGTIRKYVPYGEKTDQGYHIPHVIYQMLLDKKYLHLRTYRDPKNKEQIKREERYVKEFAIEVLEPLTAKELADLKKAQDASGRLDLAD